MNRLIRSIAGCILAGAALVSHAAVLPEAKPEDVGLSSQRLARLDATMQKAVDSGELPGVVILIAREGRLAYAKSFGWQDREKKIPMRNDSIFRIYSMTKPIVSVAAMTSDSVSPSNGVRPVSIANRTQPNAQMSVRLSTS